MGKPVPVAVEQCLRRSNRSAPRRLLVPEQVVLQLAEGEYQQEGEGHVDQRHANKGLEGSIMPGVDVSHRCIMVTTLAMALA